MSGSGCGLPPTADTQNCGGVAGRTVELMPSHIALSTLTRARNAVETGKWVEVQAA